MIRSGILGGGCLVLVEVRLYFRS